MKEVDIEKLRQIVSRTDKTGNEKVDMLMEIMNEMAKPKEVSPEEIEEFVDRFMAGHEPGTFESNKKNEYMYTSESGRVSLNLRWFFVDLLDDYINIT